MSTESDPQEREPESAVDDVRRVRERLSREAEGDLRRLAAASAEVLEAYREKLGLKIVSTPRRSTRPEGTHG